MAVLNSNQLEAISMAINEECKTIPLTDIVDNLQEAYYQLSELLVKNPDHIIPESELCLSDLKLTIRILKKGI